MTDPRDETHFCKCGGDCPNCAASVHPGTDRVELTEETLAEWEALDEDATPGPWREELDEFYSHIVTDDHADDARDLAHVGSTRKDAAFIAAARTAVPQLIEALKESRARVQALTAERDDAKRRSLHAMNQRDEERRMKEGNITALNKACAERDALQATLDRVTDVRDHFASGRPGARVLWVVVASRLRAALTPEGKP